MTWIFIWGGIFVGYGFLMFTNYRQLIHRVPDDQATRWERRRDKLDEAPGK